MVSITREELTKLIGLYKNAQNSPVMRVGNVDLSASAWQDVALYMDELGKKYGYDFTKREYGIDKYGEIKKLSSSLN
jgi:hypothetical protein